MSVNDVYILMQFIVNKNQNGYLSPNDFNQAINQAQRSYLSFLLGNIEQYQYQKSQPRIQYSMNENVRQKLMPFIKTTTLTITSGLSDYPEDYQLIDTMLNAAGTDRIRYASNNKLYSFLQSRIDPVATNPIYTLTKDGFSFKPITLSSATLTYVSTPPEIVWAFTLDVNNRPVYNEANSADPEWYSSDMLEVIVRALNIVGTNLQLGAVVQYAENIKNGGQ
jgi:hypothetical protein